MTTNILLCDPVLNSYLDGLLASQVGGNSAPGGRDE